MRSIEEGTSRSSLLGAGVTFITLIYIKLSFIINKLKYNNFIIKGRNHEYF